MVKPGVFHTGSYNKSGTSLGQKRVAMKTQSLELSINKDLQQFGVGGKAPRQKTTTTKQSASPAPGASIIAKKNILMPHIGNAFSSQRRSLTVIQTQTPGVNLAARVKARLQKEQDCLPWHKYHQAEQAAA